MEHNFIERPGVLTLERFNAEMLVLGREFREFTQTEVSAKSGLSQAFISQVEAGTKEVSHEAAKRIAEALRLPLGFFYQDEHNTGFGISMVYYRKRASSLVGHLRRLQAEVNIRRIHTKRLLRGVNYHPPQTFEFFDIIEHGGTPEDIATRLRAMWMLPIGPIRHLVAAIENAGGIVFKFPFGTQDIDAMSQWPDDAPPLFFLNADAPADRIRFSLAHELGHVVMHKTVGDDIENEADRFASEFLMPKRDIGGDLLGMDLARAAALKPHWRVSMAAIIRRARNLGKITDEKYRDLFIRLGQLGYRKKEPCPIQSEEPQVVPRLMDVHLRESGMSMEEMAELLRWPQEEIEPMYIPNRGMRLAQ